MAHLLPTCALLALFVAAASASSSSHADDEPRSPIGGAGAGIRQLHGGGGYGRGRKVGARTEVRDVEDDREVQELGRFSVAEHNLRRDGCDGGRLEFSRVVAAQRQVVSGLKYYLRVVAAVAEDDDGAEERAFDAVVVVKPWLASRTLLRFAPAAAK